MVDWHRRGLVPLGAGLAADPRCRFVQGDFFAMAADPGGFDPRTPGRRFHAVLLDVDHSPRHVLHPRHAALYEPAGLRALTEHLHPGGVCALWSNDPPDDAFTTALAGVFEEATATVVDFPNPSRAARRRTPSTWPAHPPARAGRRSTRAGPDRRCEGSRRTRPGGPQGTIHTRRTSTRPFAGPAVLAPPSRHTSPRSASPGPAEPHRARPPTRSRRVGPRAVPETIKGPFQIALKRPLTCDFVKSGRQDLNLQTP